MRWWGASFSVGTKNTPHRHKQMNYFVVLPLFFFLQCSSAKQTFSPVSLNVWLFEGARFKPIHSYYWLYSRSPTVSDRVCFCKRMKGGVCWTGASRFSHSRSWKDKWEQSGESWSRQPRKRRLVNCRRVVLCVQLANELLLCVSSGWLNTRWTCRISTWQPSEQWGSCGRLKQSTECPVSDLTTPFGSSAHLLEWKAQSWCLLGFSTFSVPALPV